MATKQEGFKVVRTSKVEADDELKTVLTLEVPAGVRKFWDWYGGVYGMTAEECLARDAVDWTFSIMELLDAEELAKLFGLAKAYEKSKETDQPKTGGPSVTALESGE